MLGKLELQKVIYAPEMVVSVISTIALTRRGFAFVHQRDEGRIIDKNQEILLKSKYNDDERLFLVLYAETRSYEGIKPKGVKAYTAKQRSTTTKSVEEFVKWHRRLG